MGLSQGATSGLGAAGAAAGFAGSIISGIGESNMAGYQAEVARLNQSIAEENAAQTTGAGNVSAEESLMRTGQQVGAAKAGEAAKGIDVNTGSALDVQDSIREAGRINATQIRQNARMAAYGQQVQASADQAQGNILERESQLAVPQSLISGGANLGSKWAALSNAGALDGLPTII
jgi:predicted ribonuclease toxin of YeeF-YezG toxin-antitoxin module